MPKLSPRSRPIDPCAWSINDWCTLTGLGRTKVYQLINMRSIESVQVGKKRLIVTPPAAFLASLKPQQAA
ncbi:hypothetical protein [Dongia sp.]|uniref:hypothetical protein n=1 Tax=Dongia sp. TaxID=1977262 RepID=UPI00374FF4CB